MSASLVIVINGLASNVESYFDSEKDARKALKIQQKTWKTNGWVAEVAKESGNFGTQERYTVTPDYDLGNAGRWAVQAILTF